MRLATIVLLTVRVSFVCHRDGLLLFRSSFSVQIPTQPPYMETASHRDGDDNATPTVAKENPRNSHAEVCCYET